MRSEKPCLRKVNVTKTKFTIDTHNLNMSIFFLMPLLSNIGCFKNFKKNSLLHKNSTNRKSKNIFRKFVM